MTRVLGLTVVFLAALPVSPPSQNTVSRLSVTIIDDATGEPTPVRVRLTDASGAIAPLPEAAIAIMWGPNDRAVGYGFQPDSSFYVDGVFDVELQPGTYHMSLAKGQEYLSQQHEISVGPGSCCSMRCMVKYGRGSRSWGACELGHG